MPIRILCWDKQVSCCMMMFLLYASNPCCVWTFKNDYAWSVQQNPYIHWHYLKNARQLYGRGVSAPAFLVFTVFGWKSIRMEPSQNKNILWRFGTSLLDKISRTNSSHSHGVNPRLLRALAPAPPHLPSHSPSCSAPFPPSATARPVPPLLPCRKPGSATACQGRRGGPSAVRLQPLRVVAFFFFALSLPLLASLCFVAFLSSARQQAAEASSVLLCWYLLLPHASKQPIQKQKTKKNKHQQHHLYCHTNQ